MTKRDREILGFIKQYMLENGTTPTIKEIGEGVCLYSEKTVYNHLQRLISCGEITPVNRYKYTVKGMKYVKEE